MNNKSRTIKDILLITAAGFIGAFYGTSLRWKMDMATLTGPTPDYSDTVATGGIAANPILNQYCAKELLKFCATVPRGAGRRLVCVIDHQKDLSFPCRQSLKSELAE